MQGLIGAVRIYWKHAAILLAIGLGLQIAALRARPRDATKRPRITGIDHVRLYVTDMNKSRDFYAKLVGLRSGGGACRASSSASSRTCFTVGWQRYQAVELEQAPSPQPKNWLATIAFRTDNLEQMHDYLAAHGVNVGKIDKGPNDGYSHDPHFEVKDPEGTPISFIQRTAYAIDDFPPGVKFRTQLLHAGFVTKDIAAENRFYGDLLGFRLYWHGGFKDDSTDWYEIQVPDGNDWIEYMLNIPANADHKELGVQNHFSLGVKDIQVAADQLHKNGVQKFDGPEIGRDGKWGLDAYDPDGTRVEVMEFTPAKTPCCHAYTAPHPKP
jgi:catechol 2,3-dioxygenase-like lactoylglutathione lyase family enzyme